MRTRTYAGAEPSRLRYSTVSVIVVVGVALVGETDGSKSFVGPVTAPAGAASASTSRKAAAAAGSRCPAPRGVGVARMNDTRSGLRSGHEHPVRGQRCKSGAGAR